MFGAERKEGLLQLALRMCFYATLHRLQKEFQTVRSQSEKIDLLKDVLAVFKYYMGFYFFFCISDGGSMIDAKHGWNASFKPQFLGFVLSLILIVSSYLIVTHHLLSDQLLVFIIFGLSIAQALIQLVFFLHLGLESKPHWNSITFLFVVLVIFIVIGGSLWIMSNLDYNLMPTMEHGAP